MKKFPTFADIAIMLLLLLPLKSYPNKKNSLSEEKKLNKRKLLDINKRTREQQHNPVPIITIIIIIITIIIIINLWQFTYFMNNNTSIVRM